MGSSKQMENPSPVGSFYEPFILLQIGGFVIGRINQVQCHLIHIWKPWRPVVTVLIADCVPRIARSCIGLGLGLTTDSYSDNELRGWQMFLLTLGTYPNPENAISFQMCISLTLAYVHTQSSTSGRTGLCIHLDGQSTCHIYLNVPW